MSTVDRSLSIPIRACLQPRNVGAAFPAHALGSTRLSLHSLQDFDRELHDTRRSALLVELLAPLLEALTAKANLNRVDRFNRALWKLLADTGLSPWPEDAAPRKGTSFFALGLETKLLLLRTICELHLSRSPALATHLVQSDAPVGMDALGDTYWYFGGEALYRFSLATPDMDENDHDGLRGAWEAVRTTLADSPECPTFF